MTRIVTTHYRYSHAANGERSATRSEAAPASPEARVGVGSPLGRCHGERRLIPGARHGCTCTEL